MTSPLDGTVDISGTAKLVDAECIAVGSGIIWSIDRGADTLLESVVPSGGDTTFAISASVETGETLYFVLAPGDNDMCDTTFVQVAVLNDIDRQDRSRHPARWASPKAHFIPPCCRTHVAANPR